MVKIIKIAVLNIKKERKEKVSKKEPKFTWHEDQGLTICVIYYKNLKFTGIAECHEKDRDFISQRTGEHIAYTRAYIDYLKHIYNYELKPKKEALNHLLGTMAHSKNYYPNTYANQRLNKEIQNLEIDIETIKDLIAMQKADLKLYIDEKDKFYSSQRKKLVKSGQNS